ADDSKNHDLERDLYIEERKAERGIYFVGHLRDAWRNVGQRRQGVTNLRGRVVFALFVCSQCLLTVTRLLIHLGWIAAMFFYWLLADYGRSFARPFVALLLSMVLFHAAYWLTLRPQPGPGFWPRVTAALHQAVAWPQANDPPFVRATRAFAI